MQFTDSDGVSMTARSPQRPEESQIDNTNENTSTGLAMDFYDLCLVSNEYFMSMSLRVSLEQSDCTTNKYFLLIISLDFTSHMFPFP
jgi:hypothetical protein